MSGIREDLEEIKKTVDKTSKDVTRIVNYLAGKEEDRQHED